MQKTILNALIESLDLNKSEILENEILDYVSENTSILEDEVEDNEQVLDFLLSAFEAEQYEIDYALCALDEMGFDFEDYLSVSQLSDSFTGDYTLVRTGDLIDWYMEINCFDSNVSDVFYNLIDEKDLAYYIGFFDTCEIGGETFWYSS